MFRAPCLSLLATALALGAALPAFAGEVYQWKDANGVTHYSQTPPTEGKFQHRYINSRAPAASNDGAAASAGGPPESQQCVTARKNLSLIGSGVALQVDSDGDGKPDRQINDAEREKQMQLNQTVVRVQCGGDAASGRPPQATSDGKF